MAEQVTKTVSDLIENRHSCRNFLDKPVSLDLIKKILNTAKRAPSNSNLQPWKGILFYIIICFTTDNQ